MILVQVWALPSINLLDTFKISNFVVAGIQRVSLREVVYDLGDDPPTKVLLFETEDPATEVAKDIGSHFSLLGQAMARIGFGTLTTIRAIAGRLVLNPAKSADERYVLHEYTGCPPGILTHLKMVRPPSQIVLHPDFVVGKVPANVEGAISWFMAGQNAVHPPVALMCNWLGIEMLAPEIKGKLRCTNKGCEKEIDKCPNCHQSTVSSKATKSIIDYLSGQCGLSRTEAKKLYDGRNDVAHGRIKLDASGLHASSSMVHKTSVILLNGIKMALSWPKEQPPIISAPEYFGGVGLISTEPIQGAFSWDFPLTSAGWKDYEIKLGDKTWRGIRALAGMRDDLGV